MASEAQSSNTPSSHPPLQKARLFFGLVIAKRDHRGQVRFRPNWPRLFVFSAVGAIGLYLLACLSLFLFLKYQRGYEPFTFRESLTAFFKLDEHRSKLGDFQIEQAIEKIGTNTRQDVLEGFRLLRYGVARSPSNVEGRLLLAEFYEIALRRSDVAADLLISGLQHAGKNPQYHDSRYIGYLFAVLLRNYMDFRAVEVSQTLLRALEPNTPEYRFVATQLGLALFYRGDFDEAEKTLYTHNLVRFPEGLSLLALIRHNQNRSEEGIRLLEDHLDANPGSRIAYERLMSIFRDLEAYDRLRQTSLLWSIRFPTYSGARVNLMYAYDAAGNETGIRTELEELLSYDPQPQSLIELFSFASETGRPGLIQSVLDELEIDEQSRISAQARISLAEAYVRGGDPKKSLAVIEDLEKNNPALFSSVRTLLNGIRAVALYFDGRPIDGQVYLQEFLTDNSIRPAVYLAMAKLFEKAEFDTVARDILAESYARHPQDHRTLSALVQLDAAVGDLPAFREHLRALVKSRIPTREAVRAAYDELASDRHLFVEDRAELFERMATYFENQS